MTASGSSTSGTYRPFGLDCSRFVDWVFYNVTGGSYIIGHGGGAHSQHGYCTAITWDQAIPGDLVFYSGDTHVGIVGGRAENQGPAVPYALPPGNLGLYSLRPARISLEGKDAIRTAVVELEKAGYIQRGQTTDKAGKFSGNEFHADGEHVAGFSNTNKYRRK